jgi:formate C-acetyltransferase
MFDVIASLSVLFDKVKIGLDDFEFVYFIDKDNIWTESGGNILGNITPNYGDFLRNGLSSMICALPSNKFEHDRNAIVKIVLKFIQRITAALSTGEHKYDNIKLEWFSRMENLPAGSFSEALQRILFVNQLIWQTNHRLIGLGHWDKLLVDFYDKGLNTGSLTKGKAFDIICAVLRKLHRDYILKSNMLLGDTGQIIVVGSSDEKGEYIHGDLTEIIINAVKTVAQPDPKVLLRVSEKSPKTIIETALNCIATGCGSPLLSNDDAVIPRLTRFGVPISDAVNYTVSACWEPLIGGKDSSLNNVTTLNFMRGLHNMFSRDKLSNITTFKALKERYYRYLSWNLNAIKRIIALQRFQYDPMLSLFMCGCFENKHDIAHGGAFYHDTGITTVALANTVNALLNIKELVYDKKEMTLYDVKKLLDTNFSDSEIFRISLKRNECAYGNDEEETIELTNEIMRYVTTQTEEFRNYLGGKLKFGLSAPTYIDAAKGFPASFDGRRKGEPFVVHISNEKASSYTELLNFASALDYDDNRFNGNVVDLMVAPNFIRENRKKFIDFLVTGIQAGFFQLQMNVVSSETLIKAKKKPQDYPNLIVRVWGFSAYMIDLPEDYKDALITRAIENEKR